MADEDWTRSVTCRYYKNGLCREGDSCRYRHPSESDADDEQSDNESTTVPIISCRFFKWGTCKFGTRCKFNHSTPVNKTTTIKQQNLPEDNNNKTSLPLSSSACSSSSSSSSSSTSTSTEQIKMPSTSKIDEWVNAPEFIPSIQINKSIEESSMSGYYKTSPGSYAKAVNSSGTTVNPASEPLCPYGEATGYCKKLECPYLHGDICELCDRAALHPFNEELRDKHTNACVKQHEIDMELSFAIQRSRDKTCGVCFEIIMEKSSNEQRFGILPNCNHCFCLSCIRKWRQAKQFENKIIRSCPECRVSSDFVCPSAYWVDTKDEKEKLIVEYKGALSSKDCKYFNKGQGKCPFGNKCFYLHALPDGTKTDVGPPARQAGNGDVDLDFLQQLILWNFLEERDNRWIYMDDQDEVVVLFSDSDDSVEW